MIQTKNDWKNQKRKSIKEIDKTYKHYEPDQEEINDNLKTSDNQKQKKVEQLINILINNINQNKTILMIIL